MSSAEAMLLQTSPVWTVYVFVQVAVVVATVVTVSVLVLVTVAGIVSVTMIVMVVAAAGKGSIVYTDSSMKVTVEGTPLVGARTTVTPVLNEVT